MICKLNQVSINKSFDGFQKVLSHFSDTLKCEMKFSLYQPASASSSSPVPVIYYLSGLTCTEENFIFKSGFQRYASEHNVCVVGPDTSPRNVNIEGLNEHFNLGNGAGFYVDACTPKWKKHFRMYSYVTSELIQVVESNFDFIKPNTRSICGHSMGGHGALICSLKNPGLYRCATAFAPLVNPVNSKFSQLPYTEYLGPDKESWKEWDATCLVQSYFGPDLHFLIDQGSEDQYFENDLLTPNFIEACAQCNIPVDYRLHQGFNHGYYFVSTFMEDHIKHHAKYLYG